MTNNTELILPTDPSKTEDDSMLLQRMHQGERNPIESIKTRIKQPDSILKKIKKHDLPMTMESVENNIFDVAGH